MARPSVQTRTAPSDVPLQVPSDDTDFETPNDTQQRHVIRITPPQTPTHRTAEDHKANSHLAHAFGKPPAHNQHATPIESASIKKRGGRKKGSKNKATLQREREQVKSVICDQVDHAALSKEQALQRRSKLLKTTPWQFGHVGIPIESGEFDEKYCVHVTPWIPQSYDPTQHKTKLLHYHTFPKTSAGYKRAEEMCHVLAKCYDIPQQEYRMIDDEVHIRFTDAKHEHLMFDLKFGNEIKFKMLKWRDTREEEKQIGFTRRLYCHNFKHQWQPMDDMIRDPMWDGKNATDPMHRYVFCTSGSDLDYRCSEQINLAFAKLPEVINAPYYEAIKLYKPKCDSSGVAYRIRYSIEGKCESKVFRFSNANLPEANRCNFARAAQMLIQMHKARRDHAQQQPKNKSANKRKMSEEAQQDETIANSSDSSAAKRQAVASE